MWLRFVLRVAAPTNALAERDVASAMAMSNDALNTIHNKVR
jgi:hypothetical protein